MTDLMGGVDLDLTIELLMDEAPRCDVRPQHECTETVVYLFRTRCGSRSYLSCEGFKQWVDSRSEKAKCLGDAQKPNPHPLHGDWLLIPI